MPKSTDAARIAAMKRAVEDEWADPRVAAAYRRWDRDDAEWGRAARDLVVDRARLAPGLRVLDIGSAHGEPGLAIAEAVGPKGHVTLVDLAPDLLDIAARRPRDAGLRHVATRVADVHDLPFEPGTFDRVTSRLAAMYFADPPTAFAETRRVLAPGGRVVFLVWGSVDQPMFSDIIGRLFKYVAPPDADGSPSPFAYSRAGTLAAALTAAGFVDVAEEPATLPTAFPGPPSRWWEWIVDTGAPLQTWLASLSPDDEQRAVAEILDALSPYDDGQFVRVPIEVIVATGLAPAA
jgi:ubiquinone/menaquinone biosynthesis C-methylase UbiE